MSWPCAPQPMGMHFMFDIRIFFAAKLSIIFKLVEISLHAFTQVLSLIAIELEWHNSKLNMVFSLSSGLLICVQAWVVSAVCGLLHVCSPEIFAQSVPAPYQTAWWVCLQAQLDSGKTGATQLCTCYDHFQQGWVSFTFGVKYTELTV